MSPDLTSHLTLILAQNDAPPAIPGGPAAPAPATPGAPALGPGNTGTSSVGTYQSGPQQHPPDGPNYTLFLMVGAMVLVIGYSFWSQSKKDKDREKSVSVLKKGDRIYTYGGIIGIIHEVDDREIVIKCEDNQKLRIAKSAIAGPYDPAKPAA